MENKKYKVVWIRDTEYGKQLRDKHKAALLKDIKTIIDKEEEKYNEFLKLRKQFGI